MQPGDVVLDCGASVGLFTREALDLGASVVLAIDPDIESLKALRSNFTAEIEQGKCRGEAGWPSGEMELAAPAGSVLLNSGAAEQADTGVQDL